MPLPSQWKRVHDLDWLENQSEEQHLEWLGGTEILDAVLQCTGMELHCEAWPASFVPPSYSLLCREKISNQKILLIGMLKHPAKFEQFFDLFHCLNHFDINTVYWLALGFGDPEQSALEWLNKISHEWLNFFGLQLEIWELDDGARSPRLNMICKPQEWKLIGQQVPLNALENQNRVMHLAFWHAFVLFLEAMEFSDCMIPKAKSQNWMAFPIGRPDIYLSAVASTWDSEKESPTGELRLELHMPHDASPHYFEEFQRMHGMMRQSIGEPLHWHENETIQMRRIYLRKSVDNIFDKQQWPACHQWLYDHLLKFRKVVTFLLDQM